MDDQLNMKPLIFVEPRIVTDINDCYFYHTMDIPGFGLVQGEWDLRGREADYLGNVNCQGKRVLEIGTASGYLCFNLEQQGAEVVAFDLSEEQAWDIVPYSDYDYSEHISKFKKHINKLNNGYWLTHKALKSKAKVLYGTVYELPEALGQFDICTFGSVLLHLRDPFLALQSVTAHVDETVVVTDIAPRKRTRFVEHFLGGHFVQFLPNADARLPFETWWNLTPKTISEFLKILGFKRININYHKQLINDKESRLYTVVGHR
jgi:2-polyprenyl-3-methyl-5-hydroxy-6-metoxy-1,4-benzoquinol methylase